jgi:NAD(P)-dependent dehydrogenase (short-subunit alcohol dehydrogenase family)
MSNPVVLITGALTGIGRAAAVAFAKEGAKVVVAGRRDALSNGTKAIFFQRSRYRLQSAF